MSQANKKAELLELLRKPQRFLSWLNTLEPRAIVGIRGSEKECPLAKYIVQSGICEWARVHPDCLFIYNYTDEDELVASVSTEEAGYWIERFVLAIDDKLNSEITADMAISLVQSLITKDDSKKLGYSEYKKVITKMLKTQDEINHKNQHGNHT